MSKRLSSLDFNEEQIQKLFGHEAAEDESNERLRQYYFKTNTYDQVIADLPLRILVGHKGIGKSALFQVAMAEEEEAGKLTILIKPDDIAGLGTGNPEFLASIREWKSGILDLIVKKAFTEMGLGNEQWTNQFATFGGKVVDFLYDVFKDSSKLNLVPAKEKIAAGFLEKRTIYVYIDDLDRGWQGRQQDITRLSALLNAVRDISTDNRKIYFRIGLRSDVYFLVRTSDESTDKIEGSVIWHRWTNHEIFVLWVKRIESFFGRTIDESNLMNLQQKHLAHYLDPIMENRFQGQGHWRNAPMYRVFMSLIRRRPRDLVKLCTLAARQAHLREGNKIITQDLKRSFEDYSQGRLQDTINEFRSELQDIARLLMGMKPNQKERTTKQGYVYRRDQLLSKIQNIEELGKFQFVTNETADAKSLAAFMYKINFLTGRKKDATGAISRKYFEENRYLSSQFVDFGYDWEVHPAYRWALQPDDIDSIFRQLDLTSSELED